MFDLCNLDEISFIMPYTLSKGRCAEKFVAEFVVRFKN